jgi:hypothetical protein
LTIEVCFISDANCESPLPVVASKVDGAPSSVVQIRLPYGFEAYLRLDAPGYVRTQYYFGGPLLGSEDGSIVVLGEPISMHKSEDLASILEALDVESGADRGILMARTIDCAGALSDGVRLELLNTTGTPWAMLNGVMFSAPDLDVTTDVSGVAGFFDVPIGGVVVEASVRANCTSDSDCSVPAWVTFGRTATLIRPNVISQLEVRPDYSYGR